MSNRNLVRRPKQETDSMPIRKIHHVAYRCIDAKQTVDWYEKHLGMSFVLAIAENEVLQQRLRKQLQTSAGRATLRERTTIEHKLAHISQRQGNHARYVGVRKNTFDLRRASAIQNLETLHRSEIELQKAA